MKNETIEKLAERAHECWADWMRHLFKECKDVENGDVIIPAELVKRWKRQMETLYANLSEDEKKSDREIIKCYYWDIVEKELDEKEV